MFEGKARSERVKKEITQQREEVDDLDDDKTVPWYYKTQTPKP
jgi:hypothetical protein